MIRPMAKNPASLRWSDPTATRRWLSGVESALNDALSAAGDQMLPRRQRRLGPVEATRLLHEATVALRQALAYAERGFPPPDVN